MRDGGRTSITIVNGFGDRNLGGAAITHAAIALAREIDDRAILSLVSVNKSEGFQFTRTASPDVEIVDPAFQSGHVMGRIWDLVRSFLLLIVPGAGWLSNDTTRLLLASDLVISKGGYVFRHRHSVRALLAGWFTMWPLLYARRSGVPSVIYSASIGPWDSRSSQAMSRLAVAGADIVAPRDTESLRRTLDELGARGRVVATKDCVLGLAHDPRLFPPDDPSDRHRLILFPRVLPETRADEWDWFRRAARTLVEEFGSLDPLIVTQETGDEVAAADLARWLGLGEGSVVVCTLPGEATALYRTGALMLSARMHATIMGYMSGLAGILVDVDPGKSRPVLHDMGLEHWLVTSGLSMDRLVQAAHACLAEPGTGMAASLETNRREVEERRKTIAALARDLIA